MAKDIGGIKFSNDIKARIHKIALKTGSSDEEVVTHLTRTFFELVDDSEEKDVPAFVERVRRALGEESGAN